MQNPSSLTNRLTAAMTAFALSIVLIGATVTVPTKADAATGSTFVGVVA